MCAVRVPDPERRATSGMKRLSRKIFGEGKYRRADTFVEKRRRILGGIPGALVCALTILLLLNIFSRVDRPSESLQFLMLMSIVSVPILAGIVAEVRAGRAYSREREREDGS